MKIRQILYYAVIVSFGIFIRPQYPQPVDTEIDEISLDELSELIYNRDGKALLINIWATWCVPCREEFPDLIKLSDHYEDGLDVVGITIDYPDELESKIYPFLNKFQINFTNYISGEKNAEKLINFLNTDWKGALPASFVYDTDGEQVEFFVGKKTYEEFEQVVLKYFN
ncbi:MAG: TlpA family protein disulfide reductase [Ignavibacterium sp.]|nr:MAG: TlpA family protein disulfide reductase [Ignavibacterium sp.]